MPGLLESSELVSNSKAVRDAQAEVPSVARLIFPTFEGQTGVESHH